MKIDYFDNIWGGTPKYGGGPPKYTFKKEYFGEGTLKFGGAPPKYFQNCLVSQFLGVRTP